MKRTNAAGNASNLFTDGNPSTGVPATVVEMTWLNAVQEEIAKAIEGAGLTLDGLSTGAQLVQAIQAISNNGGGVAGAKVAIANTQVSPADVTGLVFDKTKYYGARILFQINRQSDTALSERVANGELYVRYRAQSDSWEITESSVGSEADSHGVTFSITNAGQVQYVSDTLSGTNYVGFVRFADVKRLAI